MHVFKQIGEQGNVFTVKFRRETYIDLLSVNRKNGCATSKNVRMLVILMGALGGHNNFSFFGPASRSLREAKVGKQFQFVIVELFKIL